MELTIHEIQKLETTMFKDVIFICDKFNIPYNVMYGTLLGTVRHGGPIPWDPDIDMFIPVNEINHFVEVIEENLNSKYWVDYRFKGVRPNVFPRIGLKGYDTEVLHIDVFRMSGLPQGELTRNLFVMIGRFLYVIWRAKTVNATKVYRNKRKRKILAYVLKLLTKPISLESIINKLDYLSTKCPVSSSEYVGKVEENSAVYEKSIFNQYIKMPYCDFFVNIPVGYERLLRGQYGDYMQYPPKEERDRGLNKIYVIDKLT